VKVSRVFVAAASIFLASSPALAANFVDFESYSIGEVVPQFPHTYAGELSFFFLPGTIVEIDGDKALKLNDGVGPHHRRTEVVSEPIVGTVDVLLPAKGHVLINGSDLDLPTGVWTSVAFYAGGYGGVAFTLAGLGDFYIDNIVYEDVIVPVPEPAGWALMILGFGGIGAAMRRRAALA